jgi:hypothetical protein
MTVVGLPQFGSRTRAPAASGETGADLPRWPLAAMFVLFPVWWALGVGEIAWIPLAAVMVLYMVRTGRYRVPRGYGLWLLFLLLMLLSVIGIDAPDRFVGFVYRVLSYLTVTVVFMYVYNARNTLTVRYVLGVLTLFWVYVVVGGYLGLLFPQFSFTTPFAYVVPEALKANEIIGEMTVRRLTSYNPDSWVPAEPRPTAPFLYANGWGNVYSMLLPIVVAYAGMLRGWRLVLLFIGIAASVVPAYLTLNRGMFVGIGVAVLYAGIRLAIAGQTRVLLSVLAIAAVLIAGGVALDVGTRVEARIESSPSTEDRFQLYTETIERSLESPMFGYGAPRPSSVAGAPSVGTQGQVWMVMFSHGFPALVMFLGWLLWSFAVTIRSREPAVIALNTTLLVILVEVFYYGVLPDGLILSMAAAGLAMRAQTPSLGER